MPRHATPRTLSRRALVPHDRDAQERLGHVPRPVPLRRAAVLALARRGTGTPRRRAAARRPPPRPERAPALVTERPPLRRWPSEPWTRCGASAAAAAEHDAPVPQDAEQRLLCARARTLEVLENQDLREGAVWLRCGGGSAGDGGGGGRERPERR